MVRQERSPEAGAAKRRAREASEKVKSRVPSDVLVEQDGMCWRKGGEWGRFGVKEDTLREGGHVFGEDSEWEKVRA